MRKPARISLDECTLAFDAVAGVRTLHVNGQEYGVERIDGGLRLTKRGKRPAVYEVRRGRCNCPSAMFHGRCKHELAASALEKLEAAPW